MMNADFIDDQHFNMHFFSTDHYMHTENCDPIGMPQLVDNANPVHYMPSKSVPTSRSSMNAISQAYPSPQHHSMATGPPHAHNPQMLSSPPMVEQMDQNSSGGNQMNYCKITSGPGHYETPPMARGYPQQGMQQQNHSTKSMNHYNQKYCTDSNESVNVSATITHISETDNSQHLNYAPTPPQSQSIKLPNVGNSLNMISTPQGYSTMPCSPPNTWNHSIPPPPPPTMSTMNPQIKCTKNNNNNNHNSPNHSAFANRNESQFSPYMDHQSNNDYLSITSTPVSSQPQTDHYMLRPTKNALNQNCINKNNCESFSSIPNETPKQSKQPITMTTAVPTSNSVDNNSMISSNFNKKDCIMAEKRNVIIFKVLEQIIHPSTKSVLKETVVKNEEVITSCGHVPFDLLLNHDTTATSTVNTTRSVTAGSSGVLGDISAFSNTKSIDNLSSTNSIHFQQSTTPQVTKSEYTFDNSIKKSESNQIKPDNDAKEKFTGSQSSIDDESDEEERRQTASALLSLQSVSSTNTPVKGLGDKEIVQLNNNGPTSAELTSALSSSATISSALKQSPSPSPTPSTPQSNDSSNQFHEAFPICERLKPGIKVMAKWKDKSFYPAEVTKQLESHKWSVRFEDSASRNLFETEIIRLEHLLPNQDVMLTISGDLCIRATIKKVFMKNMKNVEIDLEYMEDDKLFSKRHKLRDVFLNSEQGSAIQAKISKPNTGGAVFADVDLDNIVVGKRSRKQGVTNGESIQEIATQKIISSGDGGGSGGVAASKKKIHDHSGSDNDSVSGKKKRKVATATEETKKTATESNMKISVDCSTRKPESLSHSVGHYHESSLAVSPRSTKSTLAMPPNELEKILGPIPKPNSNLFLKIGFLLTSGDRSRNVNEHEASAERSIPFDKAYLTKQILAGAGKVYDTFEEFKSSNDNLECCLIADTYHRSIKYIQCLAAGVPIASHLWVIDSCRANKLMDRELYLLPAGFSLITHSLSADKSTLKKSSILFKGMKFYFGSKMADKLEKLWSPVLGAAQAEIVKPQDDKKIVSILSRKLVDIIIGDATCMPELAARAKQLKIPVVSSEYIVQCLINGKRLNFESAKCFHPGYTNSAS